MCLCTDKKCFVWRGNVIGITEDDIIYTILNNIRPIVDTSNFLTLSSIASSIHLFNSSHFRTLRAINTYETSLKLSAGLVTDMYGITLKKGEGLKFSSNALTLDIGFGLKFSSNALSVNLGTGLTDNIDNQICVCYGEGITEGGNHEIIARLGKGLQFDFDGKIVPNLGDGLGIDSNNKIIPKVGTGINLSTNYLYLKLGSGLTLNSDNEICLNLGNGLEFSNRTVKVKTSDIHGDGLKTDTNGKLTINTLSTSVLYVDDYDKTLAIRTGIGFSVDDNNRLRLTTEVKFDYNSTTGELNIITSQN